MQMSKFVKITGRGIGFCISCLFALPIAAVFTAIFLVGLILSPNESINGLKEDLQAIRNKISSIIVRKV